MRWRGMPEELTEAASGILSNRTGFPAETERGTMSQRGQDRTRLRSKIAPEPCHAPPCKLPENIGTPPGDLRERSLGTSTEPDRIDAAVVSRRQN